jgi:uncharacterized protein YjbI with pentapeptide repeats
VTFHGYNGGGFEPSKFTNANLQFANFTGAHFLPDGPRSFTGGNFSNSQFINANMAGITFEGSPIFSGVTWVNTICPDGTNSDANGNTCIGHGL